MIKLIVWDWNGTLLDDAKLRFNLSNKSIELFDHAPLDFEEYQASHIVPVKDFYRKIGVNEQAITLHSVAAREVFNAGYMEQVDSLTLRDGALDVIEKLKQSGVSSIILSNMEASTIELVLDRLGMLDLFDALLANDDIHQGDNMGKQHRMIAYAHEHQLDPSEIAIVGDTMEETIIGKDMGFHTVAITGGTHSEARLLTQKPDLLIHSLNDIIKEMEHHKWLQ